MRGEPQPLERLILEKAAALVAGEAGAYPRDAQIAVGYTYSTGTWWASVEVKPPRRPNRYLVARAARMDKLLPRLLRDIEQIPIVPWQQPKSRSRKSASPLT